MDVTQIIVRGYHCDAYGHVNNARYLEFLEEARWNFLQPAMEEGFFEKRLLLFVIANINITYKKPLFPNQKINVSVKCAEFNARSIVVKQEISDSKSSGLCASAEVTFVLLHKESMKPVAIDDQIKDKFNWLSTLS